MILFSIPPFISAILFIGLGFFVLLQNSKSNENRAFFFLCLTTFVWQMAWAFLFLKPSDGLARTLVRVGYTGVLFVPVAYFSFILEFTKQRDERSGLLASYFFALVLLCFLWFSNFFVNGYKDLPWGFYPKAGLIHPFFLIMLFTLPARGLFLFLEELRQNANPQRRNQVKYMLWALVIYVPASLDFFVNYNATFYPFGFIFILCFLVITVTAIARYNLLDIQIVIRQTVLYSAVTFCISIMYVLSVFVIHSLFFRQAVSASYVLGGIVLIIAVMALLRPLETTLRRLLDRKIFHGTISEISEQKERLETELERRERLKSVGILAAGLAHEIKNPLAAIQTFTEYLPARYDDPQFRDKFCRIVGKEVKRICDIVTNLLLFSKPAEPNRIACSINDSLQDIVDLLSNEFLKGHIRVVLDLEEHRVLADPGQLKQAFLNVILNAIDAMKANGGTLRVQTKALADGVEVRIGDTGRGIPAENIPRLFDPFYTDKEGGTGLGLAITHSLIEKNGGRISVESREGAGTVFVVKFANGTLFNETKSQQRNIQIETSPQGGV